MKKLPYPLEDIHAKVLPIVQEVNRFQKEAFEGEVEISYKNDMDLSSSILTETDLKSDSFFRVHLKKEFPEFGFVTEEESSGLETQEYFWVIDPIDGTANFAGKIPIFGSSVALWGPEGPVYGILSFPMLQTQVYALKGKGAYYNNMKIPLSENIVGKENYLFGEVGKMDKVIEHLGKVKDIITYPFNFRCAIYHFTLIATGKFGGMVAFNFAPWDIAAGLIIAEEAGLTNEFLTKYPNPSDQNFRTYSHSLVTARKELAEELAQALKEN